MPVFVVAEASSNRVDIRLIFRIYLSCFQVRHRSGQAKYMEMRHNIFSSWLSVSIGAAVMRLVSSHKITDVEEYKKRGRR